jgi:predicted component of type VI protein secretion system
MASQDGQRVHSVFRVKALGKTRIIVLDTQDLTLGRSNENDLAIDEPEMSRKHAIFKRTPEGCRIEDLGTSNGTVVNGETVDHADLSHGDKIVIGEIEIVFARTSRNPTSLGPSVEYASQLKSFGSPMAGMTDDGEATMLGLMNAVGDPGDDDAFEVQRADDFDLELNAERPPGTRPRNLDAEVADLGPDPLEDFEFGEEPAATSASVVSSDPDPVWELDDDDIAAPATPAAKPAPTRPATAPAAPTRPATAKAGSLSITLEIEGAEGDLRRLLEGLAGKVLEVPKLRVRVKSEDLG